MWVQWACRSEASENGNVCACLVSGCGVDSGHSGHGSMFVLSPPPVTRQHNYQSSSASASCDLGLVDWNTNMKLHSAPRPQAGLKVYNQYGTNYDAVAVLCPCWPQLERAEQRISPEPRRHYLHAAVAAEPWAASEGWARLRHGRGSRHTRP